MALIYPGLFDYAAPPRTGTRWFVRACRRAKLTVLPEVGSLHVYATYRWPSREKQNVLRVSVVRHPCDWLRSLYDAFVVGLHRENPALEELEAVPFHGLSRESLAAFLSDYLEQMPGRVSSLFNSYRADSQMRAEDMPWALVELLESLGVEQSSLDAVASLPRQFQTCNPSARVAEGMHHRVMQAEEEFCEKFDYY